MSNWTTRQVAVGPYVFDVAEQGAAAAPERTILLLHGFPQTHRCFDAVAGPLVEAGFRLLAPDQRGYSPGARPAAPPAYAMTELVADLLAVLDNAGLERVHVVGHDWGSAVAWNLAARHPDRVRTLTAVSVPHPKAMADALAEGGEQREKSAYIGLFRQPGKAEEVLLEDGAHRLRSLYSPLPAEAAAPHIKALSEPAALTAALNWYRAMRKEDSLLLPAVTVPTTYLWSAGDLAIARGSAEYCARYAAGPYRFVELGEEISHWIPDQAPDRLAAAILDRAAARPAAG